MIILARQQFQEMIDHAEISYPVEGCGLLGGIIEGEIATVKKVYLLTNIDHSSEHFSMDPKEQFAAIKDMRKNGWFMLGNFHSHPETPARPSEEDQRLAFDPSVSYLILSLADKGQPVLKAFKIKENSVSEQLINIVEG